MFDDNNDFQKILGSLKFDDTPNPAHREMLRWQMLSVFNKAGQKRNINLENLRRKIMKSPVTKFAAAVAVIVLISLGMYYFKSDASIPNHSNPPRPIATPNGSAGPEMIELDIEYPKPMFDGTKKNIRVPNLKPLPTTSRPPFLAPAGTTNVALGKSVSSSDEEPIFGEIEMITDGDKEGADGSFVELGPLQQHVTIDLEAEHNIYAIFVWHFHKEDRIFFDVVVQVADDPDFITNVRTLFNNDIDNSSGLGVGKNMHYIETYQGNLIDAKGVRARYVRLYSNGNNANDLNHYIEVEVYGIPVEPDAKLIPLDIKLPEPWFSTFPKYKGVPNLEKLSVKPRPPFLAPIGTKNVALGKPVTSTNPLPIIGDLKMITDGKKECTDYSFVELSPGLQSITIDLETIHNIFAILTWHYQRRDRVYFDVIVQVADDPNFIKNVRTLFNNDIDNTAGFGIGKDKHYLETHEGRLVNAKGARVRYVRLYSNGNTVNELNYYTEVEVYGKPVK